MGLEGEGRWERGREVGERGSRGREVGGGGGKWGLVPPPPVHTLLNGKNSL